MEIFGKKNRGDKTPRPPSTLWSLPGDKTRRIYEGSNRPSPRPRCAEGTGPIPATAGPASAGRSGAAAAPRNGPCAHRAPTRRCRSAPLLRSLRPYIYRSAVKSIFRWKNARVNGVCKAVYFYSIGKARCPFREIFLHQLLTLALITTTRKLLGIRRLLSQAILAL